MYKIRNRADDSMLESIVYIVSLFVFTLFSFVENRALYTYNYSFLF